ncbi:MAG: hypothetical protein WAU56_07530 [Steroidobacteraceae bacterium]
MHEVLGLLARAYTTWNPEEAALADLSEEERQAVLRERLERRWRSGAARSPEQMWKSMGGKRSDGTMPGIGFFPGSPAAKRAQAAALAAKAAAKK